MTDFKAKLDAVVAQVAAQKTVTDSVVTLLGGIKAQLASALAASSTSDDMDALEADIQAIHDGIDANTKALAEATTSDPAVTQSGPLPVATAPVTGTTDNPVVVPSTADIPPVPAQAPAPTQPPLDVAPTPTMNTPGTAGDTTTGSVDSAGASPPPSKSSGA